MSLEIEDPSPAPHIIPAGEVVPGAHSLNDGLREHIKERLHSLENDSITLTDIYLLAPWRTIRNRKSLQRNIATKAILQTRLEEYDKLYPPPNVTELQTKDPSQAPEDKEAKILVLPLDNDATTEDVIAIVDNG